MDDEDLGRRVRSGEIQRGSGATLTAALLFADLRGFTALADACGTSLIVRLNQHLEAMAQPVAEQGGDVLKFLGDGLLAVFPITELFRFTQENRQFTDAGH